MGALERGVEAWVSECWLSGLVPAAERPQVQESWSRAFAEAGIAIPATEATPAGEDLWSGFRMPVHPLSGKPLFPDVEFSPTTEQVEGWARRLASTVAEAIRLGGPAEAGLTGTFRMLGPAWIVKATESAIPEDRAAFLPSSQELKGVSVWQHLQSQAALARAGSEPALLSFRVGSAQRFIDQSRTTADFWSGSTLLGYLTWKAAESLMRKYGPDCIVFPSLLSHPGFAGLYGGGAGAVPHVRWSLPNSILAIVPFSKEPATIATEGFESAWNTAAEGLRDELRTLTAKLYRDIPRPRGLASDIEMWKRETEARSVFDLFWTVTRLDNSDYARSWSDASRAMESRKMLRDFEQISEFEAPGKGYVKCQSDGWRRALTDDEHFWVQLSKYRGGGDLNFVKRVQEKERLSAVALLRRMSARLIFEPLTHKRISFPSTASIAVRPFLRLLLSRRHEEPVREAVSKFRAALRDLHHELGLRPSVESPYPPLSFTGDPDWEFLRFVDGSWWFKDEYDGERLRNEHDLEVSQSLVMAAQDACQAVMKAVGEKPCRYVAFIAADADEVGKWIRGEKLPGRKASIASHLALSEALGNLPVHVAGVLESEFLDVSTADTPSLLGKLIYCGGDDCLAMVPAGAAAPALDRLSLAFAQERDGHRLLPGAQFEVSAAAMIVPFSDPLAGILTEVKGILDSDAKGVMRRNAGVIGARRRSGQETRQGLKWVLASRRTGKAWRERTHRLFPTLQALAGSMGTDEEGAVSNRLIAQVDELRRVLPQNIQQESLEAMVNLLVARAARRRSGPLEGTVETDREAEVREALLVLLDAVTEDPYSYRYGRESWERLSDCLILTRFLRRMGAHHFISRAS